MQNGGSVSAFYWSSLISPFSSSYRFMCCLQAYSSSFDRLLLFSSAMYFILSIIHCSVFPFITGSFVAIPSPFFSMLWVDSRTTLCYCSRITVVLLMYYCSLNTLLYHNLI